MDALAKWDVLRLHPPGIGHSKFSICICPIRNWFFYINSNPPAGRKRVHLAIPVEAFELHFLTKTSYLDPTEFPVLSPAAVAKALGNPHDRLGRLPPALRHRVVACVRSLSTLAPAEVSAVLDGEA